MSPRRGMLWPRGDPWLRVGSHEDLLDVDILMAPGSVGGVPAPAVADAMVAAWRDVRPDDDVVARPLGCGGRGTVDLFDLDGLPSGDLDPAPMARAATPTELAPSGEEPATGSRVLSVEVVGTHGRPTVARFVFDPTLRRPAAWIEAAEVAGDAEDHDDAVLGATTWGVGQLVATALALGARRVVVAPGDVLAVDGGAGALTALGLRARVADGSGLKVGGGELGRVRTVDRAWAPDVAGVQLVVAADTPASLDDLLLHAPDVPAVIADGLRTWAGVVGRDLGADEPAACPGAGAGGGLAFGLAAGLGADIRVGAAVLADDLGLDGCLRRARRVVTVACGPPDQEAAGVAAHVRARSATFGVQAVVLPDPEGSGAQATEALARAVAAVARG